MKKNSIQILMVVVLLGFSSLACSLTSLIPGVGGSNSTGGSNGAVSDLWPDVPKMSGMTVVQEDMPLQVQVMVQAFLGAVTQNQGDIAFIAYSTDKTPTDVESFYSPELMKSNGWESNETVGCAGDNGTPTSVQGGLCLYTRTNPDKSGALVAIMPVLDDTTKKTTIFFARVDVKDISTATPTN